MTHMTYLPEDSALRLPLTSQAAQLAEGFARQQSSPQKREQVYWNTLAVYVVNNYLQLLGFQTDLMAGDSWNAIARSLSDTADLEIVGIGRIECRPVLPDQSTCSIPPEVWSDRVGYLVVQLHPEERTATLLGFTPTPTETVPIRHLRSLSDLIDHLHRSRTASEPPLVRLNQWLQGVIDIGWEPIERLLHPPQLAFRMLPEIGAIERAKRLNFGIQFAETQVALLVEFNPYSKESSPRPGDVPPTHIRLQVHPIAHPYLPPNLQLIVLDEADGMFLRTYSRDLDNVIQLQFLGQPGEQFTVHVVLEDVMQGEACVVERFVI